MTEVCIDETEEIKYIAEWLKKCGIELADRENAEYLILLILKLHQRFFAEKGLTTFDPKFEKVLKELQKQGNNKP
ncbi:MAG: hypothetical protein J7J87_04765 [Candidatus Diapherotrites archaeon]|nr:hypothetical protein [Candidatus Diapherotrites archaeon]